MSFRFKRPLFFRIPWRIIIFISVVFLLYGLYSGSYETLPPIVIGIFIFLFFDSMAQGRIEIQTRDLIVNCGLLTVFTIPLEMIVKVEKVRHLFFYGIGVRACGLKEIAVVSTTGDVVRLELRSSRGLNLFHFIPLMFEKLRLSPEDPDRFIELLKSHVREVGNVPR
ncbi:MAG TPA: hypothetical protein EYP24_02100 [bacterium (Candidatus Stahlbacteria)]|nr:hypothetical protein [Candidatus Stahlbacteria bacterium]